uniref:Group I intron-encoded double motif LAGLIDADG homing endonuclease n=1 Tax=Ophiostoma minus TaxID=150568 RepID=G3DRG9_9PEZI|nr:group I intron-encoded double motif LAGLIDADG homing endonuclease [Ophiostoma minus]
MVISQWMKETEMGYRGSKSVLVNNTVKEQRVDGSYMGNCFRLPMLRCTLMGLERDYQIRILSKGLYKKECKFYSTLNNNINPWFLTGFIDGEGCFKISLTKVNKAIGWKVQLFFQINLHEKDRALLKSIKNYLGVGKIHSSGKNILQYKIQTFDEFTIIIRHMEKYPLISQKRADFELFKKAYDLVMKNEHLNQDGLLKIVSLKASLNLGLSDDLKLAFPNVIPATRFTDFAVNIPDPQWLAGFASAKGCFMVGIKKSSKSNTGYQVYVIFIITQHIRDELLMKGILDYLDCGRLARKRDVYEYQVSKFSDVVDKILGFFDKYPILGEKAKDLLDFCIVSALMKSKDHLTEVGVAKIRKIKEGMNRGREF